MHRPIARLKRMPALLALVSSPLLAGTVTVEIQDYAYRPAEVSIRPGDTVRWVNQEKRTSHSIVFPAEGGRESERLFPGETWERVFTEVGRYPYFCGPHPEMKGGVNVTD